MARVALFSAAGVLVWLVMVAEPASSLAAGKARPGAESWVQESPLRTSLLERARKTRARLHAAQATSPRGHSAPGGPRTAGRTSAAALQAGASVLDITPQQYETWNDSNGDATYQPPADTFNDAGVDRLFDVQETGALGSDGKPGKAGTDDDHNGIIDDTSEYLSAGTDDIADPAHDNYHATSNPTGTEKNGVFESIALAGFQGFMGDEIRPMNGVHDPLTVRAVALHNGDEQAIILVADSLGLLFHFLNPVKRELASLTGVPFDHILISATHTHHAPDPVGIWAGQIYPDYMRSLMNQLVNAGLEAFGSLEPVQLKSATAVPDGCYDRTTLIPMPETLCDLGDYESINLDSTSGYDQFTLQVDLRDPWVRRLEMPLMQLIATDGTTIATLLNFDNHPEVLLDENPLASSDFPHFMRSRVEERLGGAALYLSGTVGCQMGALRGTPIPAYDEAGQALLQPGVYDVAGDPVPVWASGPEERTRSLGYVLADWAVESLQAAAMTPDPAFRLNASWIDVNIDNPVYRLLMNRIKNGELFEAADKEYLIRAPWCSSAGCVRTQMQVMTLGDATFVTAPGEFPPEYVVGRDASVTPYSQTDPGYADYSFPALPSLRDFVRTRELFFVGLANSYYGYAIPKADTLSFSESDHPNFYEEEYDPYLCFGDAVGNRIFQMLGSGSRFSDCTAKP